IRKQSSPVSGSIYWVVGFIFSIGETREFSHDDGLIGRMGRRTLRMEMLELVDSGVGYVCIWVIHHRRSLEVTYGQNLLLEVQSPPAQFPFAVVEVTVHWPGVNHRNPPNRGFLVPWLRQVEEVPIQLNLNVRMIGHTLNPSSVTVSRQPFICVVEVSVVVVIPHRQSRTDVAGKVFGRLLALLGGEMTEKRFEHWAFY